MKLKITCPVRKKVLGVQKAGISDISLLHLLPTFQLEIAASHKKLLFTLLKFNSVRSVEA